MNAKRSKSFTKKLYEALQKCGLTEGTFDDLEHPDVVKGRPEPKPRKVKSPRTKPKTPSDSSARAKIKQDPMGRGRAGGWTP